MKKTPEKHNDKHTTSSPTPKKHDEQTGHDELSRKAHVSGKEFVGEPTKGTPNKGSTKAGIMTNETSFTSGEPSQQGEKLSPKETADKISKMSTKGDPYEFDDKGEAEEVFKELDPALFNITYGENKTIIQRVA